MSTLPLSRGAAYPPKRLSRGARLAVNDVNGRTISFSNDLEKAAWLDAQASLDATSAPVRRLAARFATSHDPNDQEGLARDLHRFVRDSIHYVRDGGIERLDSSSTILKRGYDDCDGKARLFVALCRAVGLDARIRPVFEGRINTHEQAEVRWPGSNKVRGAGPGGYLLAELILENCQLGQNPADLPRPWRLS